MERHKLVELYQPSGCLTIYTSMAQPKPLLITCSEQEFESPLVSQGAGVQHGVFSSKIEFIAKNVLISDSSYLH